MQYCTLLHTTAQYCTILHTTAHYCILLHTTAHYCTLLNTTAHYYTILHNTHTTADYCILLHNNVHYYTILHTTNTTNTGQHTSNGLKKGYGFTLLSCNSISIYTDYTNTYIHMYAYIGIYINNLICLIILHMYS